MFEVNIRFVGGLLSAYYLSGKDVSVFFGLFGSFLPSSQIKMMWYRIMCYLLLHECSWLRPVILHVNLSPENRSLCSVFLFLPPGG